MVKDIVGCEPSTIMGSLPLISSVKIAVGTFSGIDIESCGKLTSISAKL